MGFFKQLFKKKAGGSVVGNILRRVGDTYTGGLYSSIFPAPTEAANSVEQQQQMSQKIAGADQPKKSGFSAFMEKIKKEPAMFIGGLLSLAVLLFAIFRPRGGGRTRSSRY